MCVCVCVGVIIVCEKRPNKLIDWDEPNLLR